ncbi:hypothetical protein AB0G81_32055, partial [Streptomyces asoensis]|uniref:hypothetical protein n=1 Tax=Streptomyces asoensis TaxID=249586 RepID=UPI0033E71DEA
ALAGVDPGERALHHPGTPGRLRRLPAQLAVAAWYNRALPAMRYPWEPDELCSDLRELAALRPELSEFVKELTWAKG